MGFKKRKGFRERKVHQYNSLGVLLHEIFKTADETISDKRLNPLDQMDHIRSLVAGHLQMNYEQIRHIITQPPAEQLELNDAEITLVRQGRWIEAIKTVRGRLPLDLLTAKNLVGRYRDKGHPHWTALNPEWPAA